MTTAFDGIRTGLTAEQEWTVTDDMVTRHVGGRGVLTTPRMIEMMEDVAGSVTAPLLPAGHVTVGYEVAIRHRAGAAVGARVRVRAELVEVDGRKLNFRVEARTEQAVIGEGTHRRTIVRRLGVVGSG